MEKLNETTLTRLSIQIANGMNVLLNKLNIDVTPLIANAIENEMKQNTSRGTAFGQDTYDNEYSESYKKVRKRAGLPTSPVTLRFKTKSIENTRTETTGKGTVISFTDPEKGVIFKYHHDGIKYSSGTRTRSIFPKTADSVPPSIRDLAQRLIGEALANGR